MRRQIIFKHKRALGDALMFTCGVRDFKLLFPDIDINVDTNFSQVFENNPYLTRSIKKEDEGVEYYSVGYPMINSTTMTANHFTRAFLYDMIAVADGHKSLDMPVGHFCSMFANGDSGDPSYANPDKNKDAKEPFLTRRSKYKHFSQKFGKQWADIHMTPMELSNNIVKATYGIDKYWVIAPGGKSDCTCKIWDWRKFQKIIDYFDGMIKFVVIGKSDHIVEKLDNVIDFTDKYNKNLRGLFSLVYHADGCVSGVSFLMHLAAAVPSRFNRENKPCVGIYGGREPASFTGYTHQQILHTGGVFTCCDNGGCWHSRVQPLSHVKQSGNDRLCERPVDVDGRVIPECMSVITTHDVLRAIEKYYEGNIISYNKTQKMEEDPITITIPEAGNIEILDRDLKEINILASLSSKGGGEQSALKIWEILTDAGWFVHFHPWDKVHDKYKDYRVKSSFKSSMFQDMQKGIPLLFYANDQINPFCEEAEAIVSMSSGLVVGINYVNGKLPQCTWLHQTGKLKAVIFQNEEKKMEFERDRFGFEDTELISLFGAVDLQKFANIYLPPRTGDELVVLKHCTADYRKYVTSKSVGKGEKIHVWQKNIIKEDDIKFYSRLLKGTKHTKFEFMEAHEELINNFQNEPRMVFHKFDSMPVEEFLARGHVYLYRTSNLWRDQYPRCVAEALATGLPVLTEPRDGTKDRVVHGSSGFHCIDYDAFQYAVKILQRKENLRKDMGKFARDWALKNLDPREWATILGRIFYA